MYHQTPPAYDPDDAVRADMAELTGPGPKPRRDVWQIVILRIEGEWRPGLLTQWVHLPSGWAALIRWRQDPAAPAEGWGWFKHDPTRIQPLTVEGITAAGLADEQHQT